MITTIYKDYLNKLLANFLLIDSALSIARPSISLVRMSKQKHGRFAKTLRNESEKTYSRSFS